MALFGKKFDSYGSSEPLAGRLKKAMTGSVEINKFLKKAGLVSEVEVVNNGPRWFSYSAISSQGVRHRGKMQGPSREVVSEALQNDGWIPLEIEEVLQTGLNTDLGAMFGSRDVRLSTKELATFSRQISELLRAGVPVVRALSSLGEEQTPEIARICSELAQEIASGVPMSQALKLFPKVFDTVYRSYVEAGEQTGNLPMTMARLANAVEKQANMAQKIKGVTAYPKFVSIAIGGVVAAILTFLVPMYAGIYASFNAKLPGPTLMLMKLSENSLPFTFVKTFPSPWFAAEGSTLTTIGLISRVVLAIFFWLALEAVRIKRGKDRSPIKMFFRTVFIVYVAIFGYKFEWHIGTMASYISVVLLIVGVLAYRKANVTNLPVVRRFDQLKFKAPLFGEIYRLTALFRWASTMSGSLGAGVTMIGALELAAGTTGSGWHRLVAKELQSSVRSGKPLSEGLAAFHELYPASLRAMVATGEQTGDMPSMMDSVSLAIDAETDALIAGLAARIEVALLVVMAVVVGALLMVLYLPILNLASAGFSGAA